MAFKRHFARVDAAERCTQTIFSDQQRQVCDYALVYAEKQNNGDSPYSVSFTATQGGDVTVHLHPHSQLERAVRHERQAQAVEPPTSASPAAPPAPAAAPPAAEPVSAKTYAAAAYPHPQGATAGGQAAAPAGPVAAARVPPPPSGGGVRGTTFTVPNPGTKRRQPRSGKTRSGRTAAVGPRPVDKDELRHGLHIARLEGGWPSQRESSLVRRPRAHAPPSRARAEGATEGGGSDHRARRPSC